MMPVCACLGCVVEWGEGGRQEVGQVMRTLFLWCAATNVKAAFT